MNAPPTIPLARSPRQMLRVPLARRPLSAPPPPKRDGPNAESCGLLTVRRLKAGMGLIEAAVKAGISPRLLSDLENGRRCVDFDVLCALAGVYGCQPADLLPGGRDTPALPAAGRRGDTPGDVIRAGQAVLDTAMRANWNGERMAAAFAVMKLDGALELYSTLLGSVTGPGEAWPDLEPENGALAAALRRAADDVAARTEELILLLPDARDARRKAAAIHSARAAHGKQRRGPMQ